MVLFRNFQVLLSQKKRPTLSVIASWTRARASGPCSNAGLDSSCSFSLPVDLLLRQDPPLIWVLVIFDFFAPWYRRRREASFVKIWWENSKETLVKCATKVARFHKVSIQSCKQNRPSPKVQSRSGNWIQLFIASTIFMKLGTLVHDVPGYKILPRSFKFLPRNLVMVFQSRKNGVKSSLNFERS